jgi:hypothetical protein
MVFSSEGSFTCACHTSVKRNLGLNGLIWRTFPHSRIWTCDESYAVGSNHVTIKEIQIHVNKSRKNMGYYFHPPPIPVRIQVRIDHPHSLVCRKRRLNGAILRMRPENRGRCCSRCGTIKIPPCSKALSADHRPIFWIPPPVILTSPYKQIFLERDIKQ